MFQFKVWVGVSHRRDLKIINFDNFRLNFDHFEVTVRYKNVSFTDIKKNIYNFFFSFLRVMSTNFFNVGYGVVVPLKYSFISVVLIKKCRPANFVSCLRNVHGNFYSYLLF